MNSIKNLDRATAVAAIPAGTSWADVPEPLRKALVGMVVDQVVDTKWSPLYAVVQLRSVGLNGDQAALRGAVDLRHRLRFRLSKDVPGDRVSFNVHLAVLARPAAVVSVKP